MRRGASHHFFNGLLAGEAIERGELPADQEQNIIKLKPILFSCVGCIVLLGSSSAWAYINAGFKSQAEADAYYKNQRDARAREAALRLAVLNEAIQRDPNDAVAYYQRAKFNSQRNPKQALDDFDVAIRLNPAFKQAWYRRSCVRAALKDDVGCFADLEETLRRDPALTDARYRLAALCYASVDESVRDLRKARQLAETLCDANMKPDQRQFGLLAAVCAELGDFEAAVRWETKRQSTPNAITLRSLLNSYRRGETVTTIRAEMISVPSQIPLD